MQVVQGNDAQESDLICRTPHAGFAHVHSAQNMAEAGAEGAGTESTSTYEGMAQRERNSTCSLLLPETPEMRVCDKASMERAMSSDGLWIRRDVFEHMRRKAKSDLVELESELMSIILAMEDAHNRLKEKAKQDLIDLEEELMSLLKCMEREGHPESVALLQSTTDSENVTSNNTSNCSNATTDSFASPTTGPTGSPTVAKVLSCALAVLLRFLLACTSTLFSSLWPDALIRAAVFVVSEHQLEESPA